MTAKSTSPRDYLGRFGLQEFRTGQLDVIEAILDGADCLCIMPTGGGKSLCYQLPSVMRDGVTIVVSPLIALMKDQVDSLTHHGIAASFVNSTLSPPELDQRLDQMAAGAFDLIYVAPERFRSPRFLEAVRKVRVQLLAVDEAHCISEWGHDFRHDYTRLGQFRQRIGNPQTIALTATATSDVRDDVVKQLGLKNHRTFIAGFARSNLFYSVQACQTQKEKREQLREFLGQTPGSGIIYAATRKGCEEVAEFITGTVRRRVVVYHAGMLLDDRRHVQESFMSGKAEIVVATNAFGMGIDKPDVRFVIHYNLPGSLEAYYQEAGRAGRDGKTSYCVLLHGAADRHLHEFFVEGSNPPDPAVHAVLAALRRVPGDVLTMPHEDLAEAAGVPEIQVGGALRILEDAGLVERLDDRDNPAHVRLLGAPTQLLERLPPGTQRRALLDWIVVRLGATAGGVVAVAPGLVESDLGLARETLLRVLRELAEAGVADVRPPARGRGIVVTGRSLAVPEVRRRLAPQLERAAARRDRAMERLDKVEHYARARSCRHAFLLRYFGDARRVECRSCDNCCGWHAAEPASGRSAASPPLLRARAGRGSAGVDLDGVRPLALRAVADLRGRYGLGMAKLVLRGSRARKVLSARLDASPAYGVLARLREEQVEGVLDALETEGLVETTGGPYPLASLTEEGRMRLQA